MALIGKPSLALCGPVSTDCAVEWQQRPPQYNRESKYKANQSVGSEQSQLDSNWRIQPFTSIGHCVCLSASTI